jgi:hypothetical protein
MPLARTELPRRPIVGLLLLVLAGLTVALQLWSWHLEETYKHVEVVYGQTGLEEQPAQLRVQVDCRGPNLLQPLQREARVDLGLLSADHYAAVQARDGAESPVLDFRLLVNSHAAFTYGDFRGNTPTGLNNTPGEGLGRPPGEWLIHKTFSGRGHEVASIACETKPPLASQPADGWIRAGSADETLYLDSERTSHAVYWLYFFIFLLGSVVWSIRKEMSHTRERGVARVIVLAFVVITLAFTVIPVIHYGPLDTFVVCMAVAALAAAGVLLMYRTAVDLVVRPAADPIDTAGPPDTAMSREPIQPRTKGPEGSAEARRGPTSGNKKRRRRNSRKRN